MLRETVPTRLPRIAGIRSETGDEGQVWERRHERSHDYTGIWWRMVMAMMVRTTGGLMLAYSALYTAHFIFDTLYDAQPIWTVFNIISAVGICQSPWRSIAHMRAQAGSGPTTVPRLGAYALFYANAALAIWFFRDWVHLLALEEGESVSVHSDVIWLVIAVLIPLVLATTGWRLWCR